MFKIIISYIRQQHRLRRGREGCKEVHKRGNGKNNHLGSMLHTESIKYVCIYYTNKIESIQCRI